MPIDIDIEEPRSWLDPPRNNGINSPIAINDLQPIPSGKLLPQINLGTESKSRLFVLRANAASGRLTNDARGKFSHPPLPAVDKPFSSCNRARRRTASRRRQRGRSRRRLRSPPSRASCSGRRNCTGSNCPRRSSPCPRDECRTEGSSSSIAIYRVEEKINKIKRRRRRGWCIRAVEVSETGAHARKSTDEKHRGHGARYFLNERLFAIDSITCARSVLLLTTLRLLQRIDFWLSVSFNSPSRTFLLAPPRDTFLHVTFSRIRVFLHVYVAINSKFTI